MHVKHGGIYWILSFILGLSACKDSISEEGNIPYDPSLPVAITGFTPDSGAVKTQMVIEGENFGTDTSLVKVFIGGKKAVLISAKSNFIYCIFLQKVMKELYPLRLVIKQLQLLRNFTIIEK